MNNLCSHDRLELVLTGLLNADDESQLHRHLDECEVCSAEMERLAGGDRATSGIAAMLVPDDLDDAWPRREECSTADFVVEHLEPSDDPAVLGRLGSYDVLEVIGRGGMGVVLKGYDRELKRFVAIKALAPHLAHSTQARKRFAREAQAAAAVVNLHVIAIHQVQPNGQLPFLVMPLLTGESLAQRMTARGTLELREVLRIGMQAAEGLAAAHGQGLIHRDVKPANILLERGVERAVLTDFGLARAADDVSMTRWGIIAGTPEYMSPEQARGAALDGRSDLFSLGCVLYEMATGVSPFRADSTMATLRRIVDEQPAAMASLAPDLPPWFIGIVERLLSKDPAQRFASAREVSELLEQCLSHLQQPTEVSLPKYLVTPSVRRTGRPPLLRLLMAAAFAFALVLAGVFIVLELNKGQLTIQSTADDVPIRIRQGDKVVRNLTVTKSGATVRVAAGEYIVEVDGAVEGIVVQDGSVSLRRGGVETVRIAHSEANSLANKTADAEEPATIDRKNARLVAEAYLAAALSGDPAEAQLFAKGNPAEAKQIAALPRYRNLSRLVLKSVYVNDPARPAKAIATSDRMKLEEQQRQREGYIVLTLTMSEDGWFVTDIDFKVEEDANRRLEEFLEANPRAIGLPPLSKTADAKYYNIHDLPIWDKDGRTQQIGLLCHYLGLSPKESKAAVIPWGSYDDGRMCLLVQGSTEKHRQVAQLLAALRESPRQPAMNFSKAESLKAYSIADLPLWSKDGKKQNVELLMRFLRCTVDPPSWEQGTTRAAYDAETLKLVVQGTPQIHNQIKVALFRQGTGAPIEQEPREFIVSGPLSDPVSADAAPIIACLGPRNPTQLGAVVAHTDINRGLDQNVVWLHVWDWSKSDISRVMLIQKSELGVLAPDGKTMLSPEGETLNLANREMRQYSGFQIRDDQLITSVRLSPSGKYVTLMIGSRAALDTDQKVAPNSGHWTLRLLELDAGTNTGKKIGEFPANANAGVAFSTDEVSFTYSSDERSIIRREAASGNVLNEYEPAVRSLNGVVGLTVSPEGSFIAAADFHGNIYVWETQSGKLVVNHPSLRDNGEPDISFLAKVMRFSPDGAHLALVAGKRLRVMEVKTGEIIKKHDDETNPEFANVRWSQDAKSITLLTFFQPTFFVEGTGASAHPTANIFPRVFEWKWREDSPVLKQFGGAAQPIDRRNARLVVEAYLGMALAGDVVKAGSLGKGSPAQRKQIESFARLLNVKRLAMKSVYVNDDADPTTALATSVAVKLEEKQPSGQRDGFLVLTLTMSGEGWFVTDIDFESEEGADNELKKFLKSHPKAIALPPTEDSAGPTDKESTVKVTKYALKNVKAMDAAHLIAKDFPRLGLPAPVDMVAHEDTNSITVRGDNASQKIILEQLRLLDAQTTVVPPEDTDKPADKTSAPARPIPDKNGVYWSDRNEDHWVTGMKVLQWPTAVHRKLVVEFLLRNDFPKAREIDVSVYCGDKTSLSLSEGNKASVDFKETRREKQMAAPNSVVTFKAGRAEIKFDGLESGEYTLRFYPVIYIPGEEGTSHGVPFDLSLPVTYDASYASLPIHWGKPVAGLRLGAMFQDARQGEVKRFALRDQAGIQLFVQNVSPKEIECGFNRPYHDGDWGPHIIDSAGQQMEGAWSLELIRIGILIPPPPLWARLAPGEIQPISGELPKFRVGNEEEGSTPSLKHAQFMIVQQKPEELRTVAPYDYVLPAGNYSARFSATLRKAASPDVTFEVHSDSAPFHVGAE